MITLCLANEAGGKIRQHFSFFLNLARKGDSIALKVHFFAQFSTILNMVQIQMETIES